MSATLSRSIARKPLARFSPSLGGSLTRSASTSAIPPEHPRYVDVPQPPQTQSYEPPPMKGLLPRPRAIFRKDGPQKDSEEYLSRVNRNRTAAPSTPAAEHRDHVHYKSRLTELRKKNLREGMRQLKQRKDRVDARLQETSQQKQRRFQKAISHPPRRDEVLTQPSITNIEVNSIGKPVSVEEIQERRDRLAEKENIKAEERRVNLHTLYMNARDFIVTEEQLNKKVDEVFDHPFYQNTSDPSVWAREGIPERVSDLLDKAQFRSTKALDANLGYAERTKERLQRIAEELTGGRMDNTARSKA